MWKKRNTAQCTPRISRIYSPVPPRQHNASCRLARMAHSSTLRGATATPRFHHVSAPTSPRSPQQCQVGVSDRERKKERKIPGKTRKRSNSIRERAVYPRGRSASIGRFPPSPFDLLLASQPADPPWWASISVPALPAPPPLPSKHSRVTHASHHSSTASLPLRAASRLAGAGAGGRSNAGMEIDEAVRGCSDRRLRTKYANAVYVVQRAFALYP